MNRLIFPKLVALLILVQAGLWVAGESLGGLALWLLLFFVSFNILEATLPSLVSRTAPPAAKGAALGVYNTTQAMGLFLGGSVGGYIAQHFGDNSVHAVCGQHQRFAYHHVRLAGRGRFHDLPATAPDAGGGPTLRGAGRQ